jgi:sulfite reductase (NADPH) flavoprotein alpha-component
MSISASSTTPVQAPSPQAVSPQAAPTFPFTAEEQQALHHAATNFAPAQLLWLSGFYYGAFVAKDTAFATAFAPASARTPSAAPALTVPHSATADLTQAGIQSHVSAALQPAQKLTILYGTQTGNSKKVAAKAAEKAIARGFEAEVVDMNEYQPKNLKTAQTLLIVVSTQGEGEPPIAAEDFYAFIHSARAPKFDAASTKPRFAVLALGDKSYLHFCKTGRDIDEQLAKLGAERLVERVDCDVDFERDAEQWIDTVLGKLVQQASSALNGSQALPNLASIAFPAEQVATKPTALTSAQPQYTRANPFAAPVLERVKLSGRGSVKETYHLELSLEGSGLSFEAGDALGVRPSNSLRLVEETLAAAKLSDVQLSDAKLSETSLVSRLQTEFELSVLNRDVLSKHNERAGSSELAAILADTDRLKSYLYGHDVVDMLTDFPAQHSAESLLATLRPLPARLYSLASSLVARADEAHLTVEAVRYKNGRAKEGVCSTFLADRISTASSVDVFVEHNERFKLPASSDADIIMIGAGTGVAPFRAFVEERDAAGARGKNWLFFGNPHFTTDFLYQLEWQQWLKKGVLTRLDLAFSRDQAEKIYVQHKLLAASREVYAWLESGATLYVCGDKNKMARDVEAALKLVFEREAGMSSDDAHEYVRTLKKHRRYLEDVY